MAEKKVVIDIEVNNRTANESVRETIDSMGRLRRELAQLNAQAEDLEKGTEAFKELEAQIKKTEREIKKAEGAFGDATDRIRTLSGSGVERATASFGLLREGITNLDFGKFKIGLQGVAGGFKALGSAIAATGIGLLVIGVTQLIANFDKLKASGGLLGDVLTFIGDTITNIIDGITELSDSIGLTDTKAAKAQEAADARNKKSLETRLGLVDKVKKSYDDQIAVAKAAGKDTRKLEEESAAAQKQILKTNITFLENIAKQSTFFADIIKPILDGEKQKLADLVQAEKVANATRTKNANDEAKKRAKERADFEKKFILENELEKINNEEKAAIEEAKRLGRFEQNKFNIQRTFSIKRAELADKIQKEDERIAAENAAKQQKERDDANKKVEEDKQRREKEFADIKAANEKKQKENEEDARRRVELEQRVQEAKKQAVFDGLSIISNLTELFAGQSEKQQRKAFNIQKGVSIAQAAIATYESATKSYNSLAGIPVAGPILGGIAAAAAITAGLLNIKKIAAQKFEGTAGSATGGGSAPAPNLNTSSGTPSSTNQVVPSSFALFGTGGNANNLGAQQQMIQAYVVESDISSVQRRVNRFRTASEL